MVWGAVVGALGSVAGGLISRGSANDDRDAQAAMHGDNLAMQKQFAQEGIRWRVADAKAAGIHPLYALGAQTPSFSPSTYIPGGSDGGAAHFAAAGQDIGRAIDATRTSKERQTSRIEDLAVTRAELENDLLRAQIAKLYQQSTPPLPSQDRQMMPGQSDIERHGLVFTPSKTDVVQKPLEVTKSSPGIPSQEPFPVVDTGFVRTPTGLAPVPSKDAKDRIEDQVVPEMMWSLRNHIIPSFGGGEPPSHHLLPPGAERWRWKFDKQEWQPVYEGGLTYEDVIKNDGYRTRFRGLGFTVRTQR